MRSRVREMAERAGMSERELARRLGVHHVTVCRWARRDGIGSMSLRTAESVARALGCRVADLFDEVEGR